MILGLDPGTRQTGYGLIEKTSSGLRHLDHGVILIGKQKGMAYRLHHLQTELGELFLKHRPQATAVERAFFGKNAESAFKLGLARGICLSLCGRYNSELFEYAPKSVKKVVTGTGSATKDHVRLMVLQELRIRSEEALDATDALSMAICHSIKSEEQALLRGQEGVRL